MKMAPKSSKIEGGAWRRAATVAWVVAASTYGPGTALFGVPVVWAGLELG
jgi:hypothetical protein